MLKWSTVPVPKKETVVVPKIPKQKPKMKDWLFNQVLKEYKEAFLKGLTKEVGCKGWLAAHHPEVDPEDFQDWYFKQRSR